MARSFLRPRRPRVAGLLPLLGLVWGACTSPETLTQVVAAVDADEEVAQALTRVDLEIYDPEPDDDGAYKLVERRPLVVAREANAAGTVSFPFSLGIIKRRSDRFLLVVTGFLRDERVIEQKALVNFVANRTHGVGIYLARSCLNEVCGGSDSSDWLQLTCDPERGSCGDVPTPETQPIAPGDELDAGLITEVDPPVEDGGGELRDAPTDGDADADAEAGEEEGAVPPGDADPPEPTVCSGNPCGAPHTCVDAVADFRCTCAESYFQVDAKRCVPKFVEVSAHADGHGCALRSDGSVTCWGWGGWGQLGSLISADPPDSPPVLVPGLTDATHLGVGGHHSCALRPGGKVVCWGEWAGTEGALAMPEMPREVGATGVVQLGGGHYHTCGVTSAGGVLCWGDNSAGQLGNGTRITSSAPVPVTGLGDAVEVALGYSHSCARTRAGQVVCWGANEDGQLGDGSLIGSAVPVAVPDLSDVVSISAGGYHSCARTGAGAVWCWGTNREQQLGGFEGEKSSTPSLVMGLNDARQIASGLGFSCAIRQDSSVVCWGGAPNAEPNDGTPISTRILIPVMSLTDAAQVTAGDGAACALRRDGHVVCWGSNDNGELGDGSAIEKSITPVMVKAW